MRDFYLGKDRAPGNLVLIRGRVDYAAELTRRELRGCS